MLIATFSASLSHGFSSPLSGLFFLLLKCVMFLFRYLISYVHGDFEYYQTDEDERVRFQNLLNAQSVKLFS